MIKYILDLDEKYMSDLLTHLRKHNKKFTGEKKSEQSYIYATEENVFKGSIKTNLGWDWVTISEIYYENLEILKNMLHKSIKYYGNVSGHKLHTKDKKLYQDFLEIGFTPSNELNLSLKAGTTYTCTYDSVLPKLKKDYYMVSSSEPVNEYNEVMKENNDRYKRAFNIEDSYEKVLYIAHEDDEFIGGVCFLIYEDTLYIDLLAVKEDYKGMGIGSKLMNYAEQVAIDKEMYSLQLGTAEFQAKNFYKKLGYSVVSTMKNQPNGYECYTMMKRIKE